MIRLERTGTEVLARTLIATAVLFCALAAVAHAPVALLLLVLDAIGWVMFDTVMPKPADPRLLGRAFGIGDAVVRTATIGSIALAPLADPEGILLVGAATLCVAGLVASGTYTFAGGWRTAAGRAAGLIPAVQPLSCPARG